jgi:adenylylsulfate kinase
MSEGGIVVWFTGLPASGKSTLAWRLRDRLRGSPVVLDSDELRDVLGAASYASSDRDAFYGALARLAALLARQGHVVLVAATAARRAYRDAARALAPRFVEVWVRTPLSECEQRDSKGLYARARAGEAPALPGVGVAYEPPESPDVIANGGFDDAALAQLETRARALGRRASRAGTADAPDRHMTAEPRPYCIVIALDTSEYSHLVLEHALDQASRHDICDLHAVTVVADQAELAATNDRLAGIVRDGLDTFRAGQAEWRTRLHVRCGDPADEIASFAAEVDADLLVLGRFGLHHRRGSTADRVLVAAPCPALVITGIPGRAVAAEAQCEACTRVRAESEGNRWFCAQHASDRVGLSMLLPWSSPRTGGGPLW